MIEPTLIGLLYFLTTTLLGIVIWVIRAIFSGELVPKKSVEYITENLKDQLAEKNKEVVEWKGHYEAERALGVNSRENREILLAVSSTMSMVLGSLPTAKEITSGGQ